MQRKTFWVQRKCSANSFVAKSARPSCSCRDFASNLFQYRKYAPYVVGMREKENSNDYFSRSSSEDRRIIDISPCDDGEVYVLFETEDGFEREYWKGTAYIRHRAYLDKDKKLVQSLDKPRNVVWDRRGNVIRAEFSPSKSQLEEYFSKTDEPLIVGYIGEEGYSEKVTRYIQKDKSSGQILSVELLRDNGSGILAKSTFNLAGKAHSFSDKPAIEEYSRYGVLLKQVWKKEGVLDREDGPAIIVYDGRGGINRKEYWMDGFFLRSDPPRLENSFSKSLHKCWERFKWRFQGH